MRVKRGKVKKAKHKKVLKAAKGYYLSRNKLYRRAKESSLHAGEYSFAHRKKRQSQFRKLWIKRINAVCRQNGTSYSRFVNYLKSENIEINKKIMSYISANYEDTLNKLVADSIK